MNTSANQAKKILIFSLAYYPHIGGAEVALKEITDRVSDPSTTSLRDGYGAGIEFHMITLCFSPEDRDLPPVGRIIVHRIGNGASYLQKILFIPRAVREALRLHKKLRFDGCWAMMSYMLFPIVLLRLFGIRLPYLLTLQEGDPFEHMFGRFFIIPFRPLISIGFRNATVVQTISAFLGTWARQMGFAGPLEVIPNAVDTAYFSQKFSDNELHALRERLGKKEGDKFVITTSRLVRKNAVDIVIRSLEYLPETVKFLILGVGPDEAKLKKLAMGLGLSRRVLFLGHIDRKEMPKYLKISDVFARPSRSEGMGISFVEAMAAGIPVVATSVGGITDFLFDPKQNPDKEPTGLFANVEDPEDTARVLREFLENTELRERCVANAKRMVKEQYDWNLIAKNMRERVFAEVLK